MLDALDFAVNPILWGIIIGLIGIAIAAGRFKKNYIKVPPNRVAVFTSRREAKVVRGGARLMNPWTERVDYLDLEPFEIKVSLKGAISQEGVPVDLDAVGMVRYGATDEMIGNAIQRFLTANTDQLHAQLNEILAGNLRGVVATMTVEQINGNRKQLADGVVAEAEAALIPIGINVDTITIQTFDDQEGYLRALGRKRIAEVKRDAAIGEAEAERETKIRSAEARRQGEIAEAIAATAIAEAVRDRDTRLAELDAEVQAGRARAEQAGPLARATSQKLVGIAEQEAEAARVQARLEVERQRAAVARESLQADIIAPAEAEREAAVSRAEGERQARILAAQAEAEAARTQGEAEAQARTAKAQAVRAEGEAEAANLLARLKAEAEGQAEMATALSGFSEQAIRLQLAPQLYEALVRATGAAAAPMSNIDNISIIGGGSGSDGLLDGIVGNAPRLIEAVMHVLSKNGVDVSALLNGPKATQDSVPVTEPAFTPNSQVAQS